MVANLFATPEASAKVGQRVIAAVAEFLPTDDAEALATAAKLAVQSDLTLAVDQIHRVATTCRDADFTVRLLHSAAPAVTDVVPVLNELDGRYSAMTTRSATSSGRLTARLKSRVHNSPRREPCSGTPIRRESPSSLSSGHSLTGNSRRQVAQGSRHVGLARLVLDFTL